MITLAEIEAAVVTLSPEEMKQLEDFLRELRTQAEEARLQELRDYISGGARFWVDRAYGEAVVQTADASRMAHLEQVMANDGHLAELSRKAREEMAEPARG